MAVRKGQKEDLPTVMALIQELADFERAPEQVTNTVENLEKDGFGPNPAFGFLVAEVDGKVVGLSLYYYRYSTWKGRRLYLEDIIVTKNYRGKGLGKALFEETIRVGRQERLHRNDVAGVGLERASHFLLQGLSGPIRFRMD